MDIIHEAEKIFGVKSQPLTLEEKRIEKMVGDNVLVYEVDWKLRKVKILLTKKSPY